MTRALVIACLSAGLLLPASAEAAKMRSVAGNGAKPAAESPTSNGRNRTTVILPGTVSALRGTATAGQAPARVPLPSPGATESFPAPTQLTANDGAKIWCRSDIVVGGFCVLN